MRVGRFAAVALFGLGTTASALPRQAEEEQVLVRRLDMRAVLDAGVSLPNDVPVALHQSSAWVDTLEPDTFDPGLGPAAGLDAFGIKSFLWSALDASGVAGRVDLDWRGGWLRVETAASAHPVVAEAAALLRAAARESVEIEVYRIDDARLPADTPALLDSSQAAALLENVRDALVCRQEVPLGRNLRVGNGAYITYLSDEDRERPLGVDPVVSVVRAGLEFGVRADRAVDDGHFVLRTWGRDGGPTGERRRARTRGRVSRTIEQLTVPTSRFCGSAIVPVGGALLLDHDGGAAGAVLVHVRSTTPETAHAGLTPLGALALPPLRYEPPALPEAEPSGGTSYIDHEYFEGWYGDTRSIAEAYEEAGVLDGAAPVPPRYGSFALSGLPRCPDEPIGDLLDELLSAAEIRTIALDARYDLVDPAELESTLGVGGLERFATQAAGRLAGAALDGDTLLLVGGEERGYLMDLDVQISAGGGSPPDPIMSSIFDGVALWFSPFVRPSGEVAGRLRFHMRACPGALRRAATSEWIREARWPLVASKHVRSHDIRLPRVRRANVLTFLDAKPGEWTLVSARPLAGSGKTLVVVARTSIL
ncbi:MAG: hypothetical protein AAGB93_05355 [Planctomycetota bacterium]